MDRAALLNPRTRSPAAAKKSAGDLGNSLVPNRLAGYVDAIAGLVKPQSKSCDLTTDRLKTRRTVARRGRCNMQSLSRSAFNCYGFHGESPLTPWPSRVAPARVVHVVLARVRNMRPARSRLSKC